MNPIPPIHLTPDTGTISNALDLAAWLRHYSPAWVATESLARKHGMTRIETLELLALTLGLQLEHARRQGLDAGPPPIDTTLPLPGFEGNPQLPDPPHEIWINVSPYGTLGNIHLTREDAEAVSADDHITTKFVAQP